MVDKVKKLRFTCPGCHSHKLEEIMKDVMVSSIITELNDEADFEYAPNPVLEDGEIDHYQCFDCGHVLKNEYGTIDDHLVLIEWLKDEKNQG